MAPRVRRTGGGGGKRARTAAANLTTLLGQLHGTNENKVAVLERLSKMLDVKNSTEVLAAGAAVADNVVPLLEAHAVEVVEVVEAAVEVIYLTLRGLVEEKSDETTHPILGRAAPVAQALVKVLNQELTKGAQANAELVRLAIAALGELTRAQRTGVHAVYEAGAIVPCVELCGSTACTDTLEGAATILNHLAMNSLLPDGGERSYWNEVYATGAVPPLVKLLQHTESDVASQAARALRTLVNLALGTDGDDDEEEEDDDDDEVGDALVENMLGAVRVTLEAMQVTLPQLLSSATETVELFGEFRLLQAALQEAVQRVTQRVAQRSRELFGGPELLHRQRLNDVQQILFDEKIQIPQPIYVRLMDALQNVFASLARV